MPGRHTRRHPEAGPAIRPGTRDRGVVASNTARQCAGPDLRTATFRTGRRQRSSSLGTTVHGRTDVAGDRPRCRVRNCTPSAAARTCLHTGMGTRQTRGTAGTCRYAVCADALDDCSDTEYRSLFVRTPETCGPASSGRSPSGATAASARHRVGAASRRGAPVNAGAWPTGFSRCLASRPGDAQERPRVRRWSPWFRCGLGRGFGTPSCAELLEDVVDVVLGRAHLDL